MKRNSSSDSPAGAVSELTPGSNPLSRRGFLGVGAALAGASGAGLIAPASVLAQDAKAAAVSTKETAPGRAATGRSTTSSDSGAVVETQYGKIRGAIRRGIYSFKGVPYGADTGGANRWMMAKAPAPWAGVKSTTCYTHTCPMVARAGWNNDEERFIYDWSDGIPGEDVLNLSIWTPGINDNRKRAVLVWIHGGGYSTGSNEELKSYDGERLARRGDIIVVGLNNRLNILGFLNLEKHGPQYANSANVSQLDLVFGLQWIKDNIANFGGDPNAVTIFGQSGGGGKVTYLMGMPAAKGLFRAVAMESASQPRPFTQADSVAYSDRVLAQLGVTSAADLTKLHQMPYAQLLAGMQAAGRGAAPAGPPPVAPPSGRSLRRATGAPAFQPSTGPVIPELPFYPNAPAMSAGIPVLTGNVLNEFGNGINNPGVEKLTKEEIVAAINREYPGRGADLYAAFQDLKLPGRGVPFDMYSQMVGITSFRRNGVDICKVRAAASGQAPAYNYQFRWQSPAFDGRPRAFHCAGLQFSFDNVERCANATGGGPDAQALADVMSEAWIAFVKTGNPNHKSMPSWDPVTPGKTTTMVFDTKVELSGSFDEKQIAMLGD
jgi:para-nitrobenzyl esterase